MVLSSLSCNFNKRNKARYINDKVNKQAKTEIKLLSWCEIIDSLSKKTSSIPYDTYRGTDYLKKEIKNKNEKIIYHFFEDYPEYDDEGFYNGGKITLRYILLRQKPMNDIVIKSSSKTINVSSSDIQEIGKDIFLISTIKYFKNDDPFYEDKIDFYIQLNEDTFTQDPVLIGVYWDNINDFYDNYDCK